MDQDDIDECTPRKFSFSYSAVKNFETCPRRYFETSVAMPRVWVEPPSPYLREGNELHGAFAHALRNNSPLPDSYAIHGRWLEKVRGIEGKLLVEERLAITRDFDPCYWSNDKAWYRVIIDAAVINTEKEWGLCIDWKTGKSANVSDNLQLTLTALTLFVHYPQIRAVGCRYVWLKEGMQTKHLVKYESIGDEWQRILPRVAQLEKAHRDKHFPPKPNHFCKNWCPVQSCQYWGK